MSLPSLVDLPTALQPFVSRAEQAFLSSLAAPPDLPARFAAWPGARPHASRRVGAAPA